jgi:hypothetical protein
MPVPDQEPQEPRVGVLRRAAVATAIVTAAVAGGYGVAAAQTDTPSSETPSTDQPDTPDRPTDRDCPNHDSGDSSAEGSSTAADL